MAKHAAQNTVVVKRRKHPILRVILIAVLVCIVLAVAGFLILCKLWLNDLPDCSDVSDFNTAAATEVYASDHETLLARFQLEYREPISSLSESGAYVASATIATEDERFYSHNGVDILSIARAVVNNLAGGSLEGASTITQQLVRNTVLADEMTTISLQRKFREAYVAIKLEDMLSKDEILLLYLNTINYGDGAYGIKAASKHYFGKLPTELTLSEAALLVGIPQSPEYNNPVSYPDHALERRNLVLSRMLSNGYITQDEYDSAAAEDIVLNISETTSDDGILLYPYFTSYVRQELYYSYDLTTSEIFQGGMKVYTTLDPELQAKAEAAAENKESTLSDEFEVSLVAIDPDNGYVRALVGGKSYYTDQYNLATQGSRQAGSAFKTFTLVSAIEQGISPDTQVSCSASVKIGDWSVSNIYNINYGTRSIASAFAVSSNTAFARLIATVGADSVIDVAHRMGIESELGSDLSLTLGTSGVNPLEMADAYATIANGGTHYDACAIETIVDRKGNVVVDNTNSQGTRAISEEVAYAALDVMRNVINWGTGTDAKLSSGQDAAGKTGTSENYMDSWFCGITPQYSVAIWLGDRSYVSPVPSNISAASVFSDFLDNVITSENTESFFTASSPSYTWTFNNTNLGASVTYSSSSSNTSDSKDEDSAADSNNSETDANNKDAKGDNNPSGETPGEGGAESPEQGGAGGSGGPGGTGGSGDTGGGSDSGGTGDTGDSGGAEAGGSGSQDTSAGVESISLDAA
jgi:membrane peptidoglycan carboxypeptidase